MTYFCPYCNSELDNDDEHPILECNDILINKIINILEKLDNYVLKRIFNYILTL
jgi:hypothetical protein